MRVSGLISIVTLAVASLSVAPTQAADAEPPASHAATVLAAKPKPDTTCYYDKGFPKGFKCQEALSFGDTAEADGVEITTRAKLEKFNDAPGEDGRPAGYAAFGPDAFDRDPQTRPGEEYMVTEDLTRDGNRVAVQWKVPGTAHRGICVDTNNQIETAHFCLIGRFFGEGQIVKFRVGTCNTARRPDGKCQSISDYAWTSGSFAPDYKNGWVTYADDADTTSRGDCNELDRTDGVPNDCTHH